MKGWSITPDDIILGRKPTLQGRRAIVTGGAGAIGHAIVLDLAWEGADVAIHYNRRKNEAAQLVEIVTAMGRKAISVGADVGDYDSVLAMRDAVRTGLGPVDILVNNAGINADALFTKMTPKEWNAVLSVNLNGVFHCTKAFIEDIGRSEAGRVITITSIVGEHGNIGQSNYAASKAGIIGFTKSVARELARTNVTVNAVAPGFIETEMVRKIPEKVRDKLLATIPMNRFGKPEEVAHAVSWLASSRASYVTGCILDVTGGISL